jgi:hypothetical protein
VRCRTMEWAAAAAAAGLTLPAHPPTTPTTPPFSDSAQVRFGGLTDAQQEALLDALAAVFCKKSTKYFQVRSHTHTQAHTQAHTHTHTHTHTRTHTHIHYSQYVMDVLLPELVVLLHADVMNVSEREALELLK